MKRFVAALSVALSLLAGTAHAQSLGQTGSPTISLGANQTVDLNKLSGAAIAGQTTMALSFPVTLASNQSALPVTQSGTWTGVGVINTPSSVNTNALSPVFSGALETGHVIKGSQGVLYAFEVTNTTPAGFVLIHNSATVPGTGAVTPVKCYQLPANTTIGGSWEPIPINFSLGISISFSTTSCLVQANSSTVFISADAS